MTSSCAFKALSLFTKNWGVDFGNKTVAFAPIKRAPAATAIP